MKPSAIGRAMVVAGVLVTAAVVVPTHARAGEEKDLSVWMTPNIAAAPATVRLIVRVPPRAENRYLRVTLDSGGFYRSSELPLEGDQAAMMHQVRWPGIPPGEYEVVAHLIRSNGEHRRAYGGRLTITGLGD